MSKDQTTCEVCGEPWFHWVTNAQTGTASLVCSTCGAEEGCYRVAERR